MAIHVSDVFYPPVPVDDKISTPEDKEVVIYPLDNDISKSVPISINSIESFPYNGYISYWDSKSITYVPNSNFFGTDQIVYSITSEQNQKKILAQRKGPSNSAPTAIITITVTPVNDPLYAVDDNNVQVKEDVAIYIHVLVNDYDIDGDVSYNRFYYGS